MLWILFELRAPENLRLGRQQQTYARFSLSRIELMPYSLEIQQLNFEREIDESAMPLC